MCATMGWDCGALCATDWAPRTPAQMSATPLSPPPAPHQIAAAAAPGAVNLTPLAPRSRVEAAAKAQNRVPSTLPRLGCSKCRLAPRGCGACRPKVSVSGGKPGLGLGHKAGEGAQGLQSGGSDTAAAHPSPAATEEDGLDGADLTLTPTPARSSAPADSSAEAASRHAPKKLFSTQACTRLCHYGPRAHLAASVRFTHGPSPCIC